MPVTRPQDRPPDLPHLPAVAGARCPEAAR